MEIIIHQSLCGENIKKAWGLLKTTMPDNGIAESIAFKTDLQDQAGGVAWEPVIRGFLHGDFFLLMKTFPDKSPDVRPRRAFSHVLLIPKSDIASIADIATLFPYLPERIDKSIALEPIHFDPKSASGTVLSTSFKERFNKAIHGLKNLEKFKETIIWVGEENFEQAIFRLWQILSLKEKEGLNIGINFNIGEIPTGKLNFITIPENIESKFINGGFCLIRRNDTQVLTEIGEQVLAGDENASQRIKVFQEAIEAKPLSRTDIDKIAIVLKTFDEVDTITDFKKLNSLSHVVAEYSPEESKGILFKEKIVDKINLLIQECEVSELPIIKNFNIKSFKGSQSKFSLSVTTWLGENLFSAEKTIKGNYTLLVTQIEHPDHRSWWTQLILDKIKTFLLNINNNSATVVYNWLQKDFGIFKIISPFIEDSIESEKHLCNLFPNKFDKSWSGQLKEFAVKRSWVKFHATILKYELPFESAISEQLKIDVDLNSLAGIEVITNGVEAISIINFAVANGDKRLLYIAGIYCHKEPSQLERIDFANTQWQEIWANAISNGNGIMDGFENKAEKIIILFDNIVDGISLNEKLVAFIGDSAFGNILNYKKRANLWSKLPSTLLQKFLSKTAAALLESLSKDSTVEIPNDPVLSRYIIEHAISDFLYYNTNKIKNVLPIFTRFTEIPENIITVYIENYHGEVSVIEATQLGQLVYKRHFYQATQIIYSKSSQHNNWRYALAECHHHLGFFTKAVLAFSGILGTVNITSDQWWESAEDIIVDLFPNGYSITTIWKSAGGKESDLLINATARDVWRDLIGKLRNGSVNTITMNLLLKAIKKIYYQTNDRFKLVYDLRKNYINTNEY